MISHIVQPSSFTTGPAVEGVQPIHGYTFNNRIVSNFQGRQDRKEGGETEHSEGKSHGVHEAEQGTESGLPELLRLAVTVSYKDLLSSFLVPRHSEVLAIRYRIREERSVGEFAIFLPDRPAGREFEMLRDQLYKIQIQLFETSTGLHCHLIAT